MWPWGTVKCFQGCVTGLVCSVKINQYNTGKRTDSVSVAPHCECIDLPSYGSAVAFTQQSCYTGPFGFLFINQSVYKVSENRKKCSKWCLQTVQNPKRVSLQWYKTQKMQQIFIFEKLEQESSQDSCVVASYRCMTGLFEFFVTRVNCKL